MSIRAIARSLERPDRAGARSGVGRALGVLLGALLLASSPALAQGAEPTPRQLLDAVDDLYRSQSSIGTLRMNIVTDRWSRNLTLREWSEGEDRSLIRIVAPAKEEGVTTLRVGENLWNYLPRVERTIKVPASMMGSSWMGSHFTNDDLVRESRFADDYNYRYLQRPGENQQGVYVIEAVPKPDAPVVWGRVIVRVQPNGIPVDVRFYDEQGELARTIEYSDVREVGGRRIPTRMRVTPADAPGEYTEVVVEDMQFDVPIPDRMFSLQALRGRAAG